MPNAATYRLTEQPPLTGTIPYSHYWHYDHEENHDNFAGVDHLDLDFMYGRFEGHGDLKERDRRLNAAVANTGWPLVRQHHAVSTATQLSGTASRSVELPGTLSAAACPLQTAT